MFTLSYVNTALSQSGFRIYKCYIINTKYKLSYVVKSVRVDISELSLVPSISMQSSNHDFSVLVLCTQVNMMFVMLL